MPSLFPAIDTFDSGMLDVGEGHSIYYEQSGNPDGKPAVFVHGGPGGGTDPSSRRYWDPAHYRIVLFDQRGCGKSTPHASLQANTTPHLIADMEKLRAHLAIERWQVFGGSWGSTLALAYAEAHPARVSELILRGIFLCRPEEIHWLYQEGTSRIFPDAWEGFLAPIPEAERGDLVGAYHKRLTSDDESVRHEAALAWSIWEGSTSRLIPDPEMVARTAEPVFAAAFARIECHYFINKGFMDNGQLLRDVDKIRHIPTVIVQGRYDVICPPKSAWDLHRAFPEAELVLVPDAGHSARETGIQAALLQATEDFRAP
ncbi:MAG: prolyl aminopeptidase [Polyangiales bacterium]